MKSAVCYQIVVRIVGDNFLTIFFFNLMGGCSWFGLYGISGIFSELEGLPFEAKCLWILSQRKRLMKGNYV